MDETSSVSSLKKTDTCSMSTDSQFQHRNFSQSMKIPSNCRYKMSPKSFQMWDNEEGKQISKKVSKGTKCVSTKTLQHCDNLKTLQGTTLLLQNMRSFISGAPIFFKIVSLILTINIATSRATPLRRINLFLPNAQQSEDVQGLPVALFRDLDSNGLQQRESTSLPTRSLSRFTFGQRLAGLKTKRSTISCDGIVQKLAHLNHHTFRMASEGHERMRKRTAISRVNSQRTWGDIISHVLAKYRDMLCYVRATPHIFADNRSDVAVSLHSITNVLQQEMNRLYRPFDDSCHLNNDYFAYSQIHLSERRMLHDLYEIDGQVKQACNHVNRIRT